MSPHGSFTDTPWMISLASRGTASASRGAAAIINSLERIPWAAAAAAAERTVTLSQHAPSANHNPKTSTSPAKKHAPRPSTLRRSHAQTSDEINHGTPASKGSPPETDQNKQTSSPPHLGSEH